MEGYEGVAGTKVGVDRRWRGWEGGRRGQVGVSKR